MYRKKLIDNTLETFWEMNGRAMIGILLRFITDLPTKLILEKYSKDGLVIVNLNIDGIKGYYDGELSIHFNTTFAGKPHYLIIPYNSIFQLVNDKSEAILMLPVENKKPEPKEGNPTRPHLKVVK